MAVDRAAPRSVIANDTTRHALVAVTSPAAAKAELRGPRWRRRFDEMAPSADPGGGGFATLGGRFHIMLVDLTRPLVISKMTLYLTFRDAARSRSPPRSRSSKRSIPGATTTEGPCADFRWRSSRAAAPVTPLGSLP